MRKLEEVLEDLAWARAQYRSVPRIFLCDGDAMALSNARLMPLLNYIRANARECLFMAEEATLSRRRMRK